MNQLMRQQSCPLAGIGRVFPGAEHDILAQGEGPSAGSGGEIRRAGIRVDSYAGEVMPKPRLKEIASRLGERRPAAVPSP